MARKKRSHLMDYIPNKTLYKAVMFARSMMRDGTPPAVANTRAAKYYGVSISDVAHHTGQAAGTVAGYKKYQRNPQDRKEVNNHGCA